MAVLALVLGACSGNGDDVAADDSTSSSATSVSTTSVSTTTSTSSSSSSSSSASTTSTRPASTAPAGCRAIDLATGERSAVVSADVDGDGRADTAYVVRAEDRWTVVVELAAGDVAQLPIVDVDQRSFVRVLGGADLMGSGSQDLVIVTSVGAYTEQIGFVRLSDCDLFELAFDDSSPARFLTGASVSNGEALYCGGDATLERYFFSMIPGSEDVDGVPRYEGGFQPFRIEGNTVVRLPVASLALDDVGAIELFDCLGLEL